MIQERLLLTTLRVAAVVPDEAGSFGCVDARAVELLRRLESEPPTTYGADLASFLYRTIGNVKSVVVELRQPEHALRFEAPVPPAFADIRIRQARQVVVQVDDADEGRGVITLNMGHRSADATAPERLIRCCLQSQSGLASNDMMRGKPETALTRPSTVYRWGLPMSQLMGLSYLLTTSSAESPAIVVLI